jgi:ABC-type multidrug transport system ATPase subunit
MSSYQKAPFVRLENVEKWFGRASALQDITLSVQPGDFMVLLGRNGAGKSTLLRVIARLTKPNSGKVEISGIDIRQSPELVRERLGFVAHSSFLYRNLTARENLNFFARVYKLVFRAVCNKDSRLPAPLCMTLIFC